MKRRAKSEIHFVQARRIGCVLCQSPFTYLVRGSGVGVAEARVAFSDDAELGREARLNAVNEVDRMSGPQPTGRARCPHCHQLQPWMAVTLVGVLFWGVVILAVLCGVVAVVVGENWNWATAGGVAGAMAVPGLILLAIVSPMMVDKKGPQPENTHDPAYTDARFLGMLQENPSLKNWVLAQGVELDPKVPWTTMGVLDLAEPKLPIPEGLSTQARSAELNRSA